MIIILLLLSCNKLILEKGTKVSQELTLVRKAIEDKNIKLVEKHLENIKDIDEKDEDGWTSLHLASVNGYAAVVELLLEKGADVNHKNGGWTLLHLASEHGHAAVVELLLEKGADVNHKNDGWTSLHLASEHGHAAVVELLLEKGANINEKDKYGSTVLYIASHYCREDLSLNKGADFNDKDKNDGSAALHIAVEQGHLRIVSLLLEKGAQANEKNEDKDGRTALHIAALNGHKGLIELLISKGANVNEKDEHGITALYLASHLGDSSVVSLLIEKGANVDAKNDGSTALYLASVVGHKEVVSLLIEKGANINIKDNFEMTVLGYYKNNGEKYKLFNLLKNAVESNISNINKFHLESSLQMIKYFEEHLDESIPIINEAIEKMTDYYENLREYNLYQLELATSRLKSTNMFDLSYHEDSGEILRNRLKNNNDLKDRYIELVKQVLIYIARACENIDTSNLVKAQKDILIEIEESIKLLTGKEGNYIIRKDLPNDLLNIIVSYF